MSTQVMLFEAGRDLHPDEPGDPCLQTAGEDEGSRARTHARTSSDGPSRRLPKQTAVASRKSGGHKSPFAGILGSCEPRNNSGAFFSPSAAHAWPKAESPGRSKPVNRDKDEDFHDGEWDIFDLFNATNGKLRHDGLLDISQLYEYSPSEAEELNVPRLLEIWDHTATGCGECAKIVEMLRKIRSSLSEDDEETFGERPEGSDMDVSNSFS